MVGPDVARWCMVSRGGVVWGMGKVPLVGVKFLVYGGARWV